MENKKYSVLVVALYCHPMHVKNLINHLQTKNPLVDVTLLTEKVGEMRNELTDKTINIINYDVPTPNISWLWLKSLVIRYRQNKYFSHFSKGKRYDIVNIQFPQKYMSYAYKYLRRMSKNIVVTPWGSDVLRKNEQQLKILGRLYRNADYIATEIHTPLGKKIIDEFQVDPQKMVGNFFGSDIVDFALKNGASISQEDAKERFGLTGKYVITCGYNRRAAQRHKNIIRAINEIKDRLPDNYILLFPMTYTYSNPQRQPKYLEECRQECEEKGIPAVFVTDYLSDEDVYKLRKATDMFIHVQTTDASSGSVQEYILCDKKIVHGSWIKYEMLESFKPLFYFPVDKIENLGEVIANAYESPKIEIPQGVFDYVKKSGWDHKATLMNEFFMSIV